MLKSEMSDNRILQPSVRTIVASASDIFLTAPRNLNNRSTIFSFIRDKVSDTHLRLFVNVVGYIGKAFIDCPLLLFVQLRTGFGQSGCFSDGVIVAD